MGLVPNLVTGVWVGGEDRSIHFEEIAFGQGASMALPIWGLYMKGAYENEELGISQEAFLAPEQVSIVLDCEEYDNDADPTVPAKPKANLDQLGF
jgi:penicillin-binding protein 1A